MPTPYMVGRFNALAKRCNLELEAWFSRERAADRSWAVDPSQWNFRARYLHCHEVLGKDLCLPLKELVRARPDVLVLNYDEVSMAVISILSRVAARRVVFRALPTYQSWVPRNHRREIAKSVLFRLADGAEVPGDTARGMATSYGMPPDRAWTITQSIDLAHFSGARGVPEVETRHLKQELGLSGCVFIYVGRLWSGKGIDYLLSAFTAVRERHPDTSLLLVGDGVEEAEYRRMAANIPRVVFTGFVQPAELPKYYAVADVMVFPTLGDPHGLVVEEALAAGLPIVASCAAGDITTRLPDGVCGFVVPPANGQALAARMTQLASDPVARARMASRTAELVVDRAHENWAMQFEQLVCGVLSRPARRRIFSAASRVFGPPWTPENTIARVTRLEERHQNHDRS